MREIVTLHIGQAGCQMSHAIWELACLEHSLDRDGKEAAMSQETNTLPSSSGEGIEAMFKPCNQGNFTPRSLLIDLEPTVVDQIRTGAFRQLWDSKSLITGKQDAASNYARAYYSQSHSLLPHISFEIRKLVEACDHLQCFKLLYSANGGTGSGLTSAICDELSVEYVKLPKFATVIYPSPDFSEVTVEPYNALLHTTSTIDLCDCVTIADNQAIMRTIQKNLGVDSPGWTLINRVIAKVVNALYLSHRYHFMGQQRMDVADLLINLIPYPRVHFPIISYAPFVGAEAKHFENLNAKQLLLSAFDNDCQLASINTKRHDYISCAILFRGDISQADAVGAVASVKGNSEVNFVEWCPTGFKTGINFTPPIGLKSDIVVDDRSLSMIAGNLGVVDTWRTTKRHFSQMFSKRAFIQWYVSEGMEEGEFSEAEAAIDEIIQDYTEIAQDAEFSTVVTNNSSTACEERLDPVGKAIRGGQKKKNAANFSLAESSFVEACMNNNMSTPRSITSKCTNDTSWSLDASERPTPLPRTKSRLGSDLNQQMQSIGFRNSCRQPQNMFQYYAKQTANYSSAIQLSSGKSNNSEVNVMMDYEDDEGYDEFRSITALSKSSNTFYDRSDSRIQSQALRNWQTQITNNSNRANGSTSVCHQEFENDAEDDDDDEIILMATPIQTANHKNLSHQSSFISMNGADEGCHKIFSHRTGVIEVGSQRARFDTASIKRMNRNYAAYNSKEKQYGSNSTERANSQQSIVCVELDDDYDFTEVTLTPLVSSVSLSSLGIGEYGGSDC